jgi:hypothetical protein
MEKYDFVLGVYQRDNGRWLGLPSGELLAWFLNDEAADKFLDAMRMMADKGPWYLTVKEEKPQP